MFSTSMPLNNNKIEKGDYYEDDFEPESNSDDVSNKEAEIIKESDDDNRRNEEDPPLRVSSPTGIEKGQREIESPGREKSNDEISDNDSEMDADAYNFTEDQKRAMMELLVQKQEDNDLLEDPPEYNVKGRLEQLNAELASEPTPLEGDREPKVGFKSEIVDLVAPPPDFSDDESQPNSARGEPQSPGVEPKPDKAEDHQEAGSGKTNNENDDSKSEAKNEKQFVVEREGNFEVLSADELTSSERAMLMPESEEQENSSDRHLEMNKSSSQDQNNSSTHQTTKVVPKPPSKPRPNTATTSMRRNVRPAQSPRPKSASQTDGGSNSSLNYFDYISPYAMTPEQKEHSKEAAKRSEEARKERERREKEEAKQRQEENERSFQAWLKAKRDENRRRQEENDSRLQSEHERSQEDEILKLRMAGIVGQSDAAFKTYDIIYPYLLKMKDPVKEENEKAYKQWLKEKRVQGKKEKLLKRRQQQEMMEAFYIRPREECDKAFREWLRKKNADLRRQHEMERQRSKMYRIQVKRSKKTQALLKAMKESQAFRYVDYYGYRY